MFNLRPQKKDVYIFTHIPKTGGTTLRVHFQNHLKDQLEFIHLANKGHKWANEKGLKEYSERTLLEREQAKVILGHQVNFETKQLVPNLNPIEIVFFRDPVQWEISRFNQYVNRQVNEGKEVISFQQWMESIEKTHSQFEWFLSNYLKLRANVRELSPKSKETLLFYALQNFNHVYFLEDFKQKTNEIFQKLCIPQNPPRENIVGKHKKQFFDKLEENTKLLSKICKKDIQLYKKVINIYKR